uniref:Uncharacterized protein n=1 Tax=Arundo donax TaxID=35708 RepID=A0A0A9BHX4_ARUDO
MFLLTWKLGLIYCSTYKRYCREHQGLFFQFQLV